VAASAVARAEPVVETDYTQFGSVAEFREYLRSVPAEQALAVWLNVQTGEREAEGFGTPITSVEVSSKAGEGRSLWFDEKGEALREVRALLADAKRPKIVHDPKLMQILGGNAANIQHATEIYSYLLRPTTANHNFADVIMRQFNAMLGGAPGERADYLHRLAPALRAQIDVQALQRVYDTIDLPVAGVLANIERAGIRVDPNALDAMSLAMRSEEHTSELQSHL